MHDDKIHAEIKALLDEVLAIDNEGNRLLDDSDLHPMTEKLEELVSTNTIEIAYEYIVSDACFQMKLERKEKPQVRSVLTVKDAAELLGVSSQSIRNLIKNGKLKATEIGTGTQRKTYTIKRSDLDDLGKVHEDNTPTVKRKRKGSGDGNEWGL